MADSARPLITVVTPSYNQGEFIERTIRSVLDQNYPNLEYLVMDGGSTDATMEILARYEHRLTWISEKDHGQAHAVNKGWKLARGEIVGWLNSDDTYEPGALHRVADWFATHGKCHALYGEGHHITEDDRFIEQYPSTAFDYELLKSSCFICQPTVFLKATVIEQVGYLNEALNFCLDYEYWIRIAKKRLNFCFLQGEHLANTRFYPTTKTSGQREKVHAEILAMTAKQFGVAPIKWIRAYAQVRLERRQVPRWLFVVLESILSCWYSLRYNKGLPEGEIRRWAGRIKKWRSA